MTVTPSTLCIILAGGLARRMGGGDKPLRTIGGKTILDHVIGRMTPQCAGLAINANGDPARFAPWGLHVEPDSVEGFVGPLAGVLAGMDWAARTRPDCRWVVSVAADCPFLPDDLVERFQAAHTDEEADIAVASSEGQSHPVIALWRVDLREDLRRALVDENMRKIDRWTARYKVANVEWPVAPVDPFFNANTPEDIALAETLLGGER